MAIVTLQDVPALYTSEYAKSDELSKKYPKLTNIDATWRSPSSDVIYSAPAGAGGGEVSLLTQLQVVLANSFLNATKWNSIQAEIDNYLLLTGGTLSGFLAMTRNELRQPQLKDYSEKVVTIASATGTVNIDLSLGNIFDVTLTGATIFTFSNPAPSGQNTSFTMYLNQGGTAQSVTYPTSVKWSNDTIPTISVINKTYVLSFTTKNAGSRYYGMAITNFTT